MGSDSHISREHTDLVFYLVFNDGAHSVEVVPGILGKLGISEKEAFAAAEKNERAKASLMKIGGVVNRIAQERGVDISMPDLPVNMIVCNAGENYGAAAGFLTENMEDARKQMGCAVLQIIPSSVHEVIYIPSVMEGVEGMVKDVNEQCLRPEDVLSDHPYFWDGKVLSNRLA